jgi:DNA-binding GntR family transcriptional regulator|tara:strand:- start:1510 stop:2220 length:711 start_codon:yes stop_codon:yes gene_type:complete
VKRIKKYHQIQDYIKKRIQTQKYPPDSYLPSENEFCAQFGTTRTTVRKALDELLKEGFIAKEHGKGSKVLERGKYLGLLSIKGFSGSTDYKVLTKVTEEPKIVEWDPVIGFPLSEDERSSKCVYFQRVRYIDNKPVVLENNWYALNALEPIRSEEFVEGSFFKTLSQEYLIEIMGAEQELRSVPASGDIAEKLGIAVGAPILHISIRFRTSRPNLNLYGDLYCNTTEYPIRNSYFL